MLKAAALARFAETQDPHLLLAERYFAGQYLLLARNFAARSYRPLEKAVGFLTNRYPQLALDNNALKAKQKKLFPRLCNDHELMQATVKKKIEQGL